jgi:hypothetical protein
VILIERGMMKARPQRATAVFLSLNYVRVLTRADLHSQLDEIASVSLASLTAWVPPPAATYAP